MLQINKANIAAKKKSRIAVHLKLFIKNLSIF